jgi:hypothetical protein
MEQAGSCSNISDLFLGGAYFESRSRHQHSAEVFLDLPQSLLANGEVVPQIGPQPLPSTSLSIHYLLIILQCHVI